MAKEVGAVVADAPRELSGGVKDEDASLRELQQHLQLEPFDGKYLTKQEILLLELFSSVAGVSEFRMKNTRRLLKSCVTLSPLYNTFIMTGRRWRRFCWRTGWRERVGGEWRGRDAERCGREHDARQGAGVQERGGIRCVGARGNDAEAPALDRPGARAELPGATNERRSVRRRRRWW